MMMVQQHYESCIHQVITRGPTQVAMPIL